jgi:PAB-dependent poly(A)-specific ribonuclease subunit 3
VPLQGNGNGLISPPPYDPFVTPQSSIAAGSVTPHAVPGNPFSHEAAAAVAASMGGAAFFSGQTGFQQPVQYHLYAPIGPHSQHIMGYQRNVHDLFLPNDLREELQKRSAATLQTLPSKHMIL